MHMGIVTLLIVLFFGSVLFISYSDLERNSDNRLDMLINTRQLSQSVTIMGTTSDGGVIMTRPQSSAPTSRLALRMQMIPGIVVTTDESRAIKQIQSAYDMDESFYSRIVEAVYGKNKPSGKLHVEGVELKYSQNGDIIAFLDVTRDGEIITNMLGSFLMIALPLMALIFLVSLFFANRSIRPIERSYNRQKEFIADASHELKTPLTALSANLDALGESVLPEQQKWIGYMHSEVSRMAGLANNLLYLAKLDYGAADAEQMVDISKLLAELWLSLEAVLFEKGVTLETDIEPGLYVQGDGEQLRRLFGILSDNALRYAAGAIEAVLVKTQGQAVLTVTNDGPGVPPDEQEKIWERFYRCDRSRQYDGGYGLGLPMAKAITERHKGKITCVGAAEGPTTFTVKLPLRDKR